jgi:hypothetical protein
MLRGWPKWFMLGFRKNEEQTWRSAVRILLAILSVVLLAGQGYGEPLVLADKGQAKATIVVAADAPDKVKAVAQELQHYLEKISGAKPAVASEADNPQGTLVFVGPGKAAAAMGVAIPSGLTSARREEGFVIACDGVRLLLAGNDTPPYHGTEYAVYDFLRSLGVRWFMPGEAGEVVPHLETIAVEPKQITEKPDFVMRNWWLHTPEALIGPEKLWRLHNKMNPDALFAVPGDSTVRNVVPPEEMVKEKPELFALKENGTRDPHLPNLTNPESVQYAAEVIKKRFREHPEETSYGFAPDDGLPRDFNPETVKLNRGFTELGQRPGVRGEVSISEEWFTFVNAVAAEVHKEFPDAYIATNGYANRDFPPQGVQPDEKLVVMFAAIWSCTLHAYDDSHCWQKVRQGEMLEQWCRLSKNVWIYGYAYNMLVSGLTPLPEFTKLRRDFPLMKKWGVMGFFDETRNVWAEPGIASKYLKAQLEWNADADVDAILDDFFAKWYGAAAGPAGAFWRDLDEAFTNTPVHGHEDRILPEIYTPALLAKLEADVAEAERVADSDAAKAHVRADRLTMNHLREYVAMNAADAAADYAGAASHADAMLAIRKDLMALDPFYINADESGYDAGVWYWKITDRAKFYREQAAKLSGASGDAVAVFPETAQFRTDPNDEGLFARWYLPETEVYGRHPILTTHPYYVQGYDDPQGHTYTGSLWYWLSADVPESARGRKVMLYAPVVVTEAWVWVNGQYVGHRPYVESYTRPAPLEFDVTAALKPGERNTVAVRVSTSLSMSQAAEGFQGRAFLYAPK